MIGGRVKLTHKGESGSRDVDKQSVARAHVQEVKLPQRKRKMGWRVTMSAMATPTPPPPASAEPRCRRKSREACVRKVPAIWKLLW